ncbi:MAG: substrate-binding domain-containing protein [Mobilitalea sp.]
MRIKQKTLPVSHKMQKKKSYLFIVLLLLLTFLMQGCIRMDQVQDKPYIAVISKSTESKFWKSVFSGVNAAATEYGVAVTFEGADNEEDYQAQNDLIEEAIANGAQAIVFSAIDYTQSVAVVEKAVDAGIYVVIIDSGIDSDKVNIEISTDNYAAGAMAAEAVLQNDAKKLKIGIVNFDINSANGRQREAGFKDKVLQDERSEIIDIINVDSNISASDNDTKEMLKKYPEINVIATLNEWTTLGVGYAVDELNLSDQIQVVGFDSNVILADMLEKGRIDALIVQNPFAIGYLGVENAYQLIKKNKDTNSVIYTDTTLITRENMYEESSQQILFPIDSE